MFEILYPLNSFTAYFIKSKAYIKPMCIRHFIKVTINIV